MKKILIFFYVLLSTVTFKIAAQTSCKRVNFIKNKSERKVMSEYIKECQKKGFLKDKKGIILLEVYKNPGNAQKMWSVSTSLYGGIQTAAYSKFNGYYILIYETDINNRSVYIHDSIKIKELKNCIKKVIGNSILPLPEEPEPKYVEIKKMDGTTKMEKQIVAKTGNGGSDYFINFYKKGKYTRIPAA